MRLGLPAMLRDFAATPIRLPDEAQRTQRAGAIVGACGARDATLQILFTRKDVLGLQAVDGRDALHRLQFQTKDHNTSQPNFAAVVIDVSIGQQHMRHNGVCVSAWYV